VTNGWERNVPETQNADILEERLFANYALAVLIITADYTPSPYSYLAESLARQTDGRRVHWRPR